ncbi:Mediator of RNA polymerase II transcription subunit 14 [Ophiocordyceps camponoti-floridani]|uniref:Mediator of RNA polymerase II transcription subunit 14 n=1 Tax=Ophiocordyceps camponoti-floridani TaxID=2030778 RepID=A0A8H4Q6R7_9HYPO|nr:Mediator of RNA polymerase II transcription subunit 14 [Ophiocordyceps camponoti-floridani]
MAADCRKNWEDPRDDGRDGFIMDVKAGVCLVHHRPQSVSFRLFTLALVLLQRLPIERHGRSWPAAGLERDTMALASSNNGDVNNGDVNGAATSRSRMNDLPDEIIHITQGFVPLSLLLTRLAQTSHNALQDKMAELAKMPLPATAVNGNATSTLDDTSTDNLRKKAALASFAQDLHGKWLKALVITEWSRKSDMVSKLIDLKFHIDQQRILYDACLENVVNVKRDLTFARMPSPDLKTALQILSTGTAPWMPDLNYIEPPRLTPREQLKWISDLNTLLSLRLNLDDYDKIPPHFKDYDIASGRVTFKVDGEFHVDLTIADEDFEKQYWFIDFRYDFSPAPASLSPALRAYLEGCVNEALSKEGLAGCYRCLHEFVLTSKINELKRQAVKLSRTSWTGTLSVEPLNRALAIQYWTSRAVTTGSKSWILLAVNSGRKPDAAVQDVRATSFIVAKWYRNGKEVKDVDVEMDLKRLSAESLLTDAIGRHIDSILTSIHDKLLTAARYKDGEAGLVLDLCRSDPAASSLSMQVGKTTLSVEPTTGVFVLKPQSKFTAPYEHQLNNGRNVADDGAACLENVRCAVIEDEMQRRGSMMGWRVRKPPLTVEETKTATRLRSWTRALWLQRDGWGAGWFMAALLGVASDEWWLVEVSAAEAGINRRSPTAEGFTKGGGRSAVKFKSKLPLPKGQLDLTDDFWSKLTLFTTGMMTQSMDVRELQRHRIKSRLSDGTDLSSSRPVRLPSLEIPLSAVFPSMAPAREGDLSAEDVELFSLMQKYTGAALTMRRAWADDVVQLNFTGMRSRPDGELVCLSEAVVRVRKRSRLAALKDMVDGGVVYRPRRGEFSVQLERRLGEPMVEALRTRIKAVDRFVNMVEALDRAGGAVSAEQMTLGRVTFCYGKERAWRLELELSSDEMRISVSPGNPHLRVMDLMRRLVNSDGGIGALIAWLPASLPALQALTTMESHWEASSSGRLTLTMKSPAWMMLTWDLVDGRCVTFEMQMRRRRGEVWWHLWRADALDDEVAQALAARLERVDGGGTPMR